MSAESPGPGRNRPPKKKSGQARGRRSLNGKLRDLATQALLLGDTEKGLRAKVSRGLVPYRRLGGRIVFLAEEIEAWLRQLPGVGVEEALTNARARQGAGE